MEYVVAAAAQDQASEDVMAKVEKMMEDLKAKTFFLYTELAPKRAAHPCALRDSIRMQLDRKNAVEE